MYQSLIIGGLSTLALNEIIKYNMYTEDTDIIKPTDTVSIILTTYNEEKYIGKTLESIYNQSIIKSYPEYFEVIVIDGNSKDNTVKIAKQYTNKVYYELKKGKLSARNYGISISTGNIIVATDGDRIYYPNWLNALLKPFNDSEVVGVSGSNTDYGSNDLIAYIQPTFYYILSLWKSNRLDGGNSAFKKEVFNKIGRFNEDINQFDFNQIMLEEELYFGDKLSQYGKIKYVMNATNIHMGNDKVSCRFTENSNVACNLIGIGLERF